MGRPKDSRRQFQKSIMSEGGEHAFAEYFRDWTTNREVTKQTKNERNKCKLVNSSVGRYSNKFLSKGWLNKDKRWFIYSYKKNKKTVKQPQKVPYYKGNIEPFIGYFYVTANDYQLHKINSKSIGLLNIFFELKDVRDFMLLCRVSYYTSHFSFYEAFQKTLEDKLFYSWLYFKGNLGEASKKFVFIEEKIANKMSGTQKIIKKVKDYYQDKRADYDKIAEREDIIKTYNLCWDDFHNSELFKLSFKINKIIFSKFPDEWIIDAIKMKYFARLLYSEDEFKTIAECFLKPLTKQLIFRA
jgi:hypothetical protein